MRTILTLVLSLSVVAVLAACEPVEGDFEEPLPEDPMEKPLQNNQ